MAGVRNLMQHPVISSPIDPRVARLKPLFKIGLSVELSLKWVGAVLVFQFSLYI